MPESKHRRKNKNRPRPRQMAPVEAKPKPSPTWVPATGASLLGVGVLIIIVGYLPVVSDFTSGWWALGSSWPLVIGFVLLSAGFGLLTRWR